MGTRPNELARIIVGVGTAVAIAGGGACVVDDIPACPGRCFEFTLQREAPTKCLTAEGDDYDIPLTGSDPDGYRGRHCFNAATVPLVVEAIDQLHAGAGLSDLGTDTRNAYVTTVSAVQDALRAECILAAPGQCINADEVCTSIAAEMYAQLVVEQTCVLALGGVEPVELPEGQACHGIGVDDGTSSAGSGEPCPETTTGTDEGVDDTSGSGSADETTGDTGDADDTSDTTGMMVGPFGDLDALVACTSQRTCEVDRSLLSHVSAHLDVLARERATLAIVGREAPCGPGAQIGGLDPREHATALAEALGLRNGDVIHEVESIAIEGLPDAMDALASLLEHPSATIVVRRPGASGCTTLTLDVDVR